MCVRAYISLSLCVCVALCVCGVALCCVCVRVCDCMPRGVYVCVCVCVLPIWHRQEVDRIYLNVPKLLQVVDKKKGTAVVQQTDFKGSFLRSIFNISVDVIHIP